MQNVMDFGTENTNLSEASRSTGAPRAKTLDQGASIIVKVFPNLHEREADGKTYKQYYFYQKLPFISPRGDAYNWTRTSMAVLGEKDPQTDEFFRRFKELKESGIDSKSPEYQQRKKANDSIKPKDRVVLALHVLGSTTVDAWDFPFQVAERLFGAAGGANRDPIEGVSARYAKFGINIFDPKCETNWVKITSFRDTNGMTSYSVEPATTEQMDQSTGQIQRVGIRQPASAALASMTLERFPKLEDYVKADLWTMDEVRAYVASNFSTLPQRLFDRVGKGGQDRQDRLTQGATPAQTQQYQQQTQGFTQPQTQATPVVQNWGTPPAQYVQQPQQPQQAQQAQQAQPQQVQYVQPIQQAQPQQAQPQYAPVQPAPTWPAAVASPVPSNQADLDNAALRGLFQGT